MDAVVEEVVAVPELNSLRPSPEQRTNVVLRLLLVETPAVETPAVETPAVDPPAGDGPDKGTGGAKRRNNSCLLYTSDAADE